MTHSASAALVRTAVALCGAGLVSCSTPATPVAVVDTPKPPDFPEWLARIDPGDDKLCGYGVAGSSYDPESPYPKEMAEARAVENLAGIIATRVQEAMIDEATDRFQSISAMRVITVDPELIERMRSWVETDFWRDAEGAGPFAGKGFTYAHTCVDRQRVTEALRLPEAVRPAGRANGPPHPKIVPAWIDADGQQADGRLCAIGFSLPTFHQDKTFGVVIEDIRSQLADRIKTFIVSHFEDISNERGTYIRAITIATHDAISKGAVVTHYWYDRDGIGPFKHKRSTYGFGCVYPVTIVQRSVNESKALDQDEIQRVKERAAEAFADLEEMEDKYDSPPQAAGHLEDNTDPRTRQQPDPEHEFLRPEHNTDETGSAPPRALDDDDERGIVAPDLDRGY